MGPSRAYTLGPQNPRTPPDPIGRFSNLRKHPIDFHGSHYLYGVAIELSRPWLDRCRMEPLNRLNSTTEILFQFLRMETIFNEFICFTLIDTDGIRCKWADRLDILHLSYLSFSLWKLKVIFVIMCFVPEFCVIVPLENEQVAKSIDKVWLYHLRYNSCGNSFRFDVLVPGTFIKMGLALNQSNRDIIITLLERNIQNDRVKYLHMKNQ